jgi:hypothetical protein
MRKPEAVIAVVLLVIAALAFLSLFRYWNESKSMPADLASRQEYTIAVGDVSRAVIAEPVVCFIVLPPVVWLLALVGFFPRSSLIRNVLAAALVLLLVFSLFTVFMDGSLKNRDASYALPPSLLFSSLMWALVGVSVTAVLWFGIERWYVSRRIAPGA